MNTNPKNINYKNAIVLLLDIVFVFLSFLMAIVVLYQFKFQEIELLGIFLEFPFIIVVYFIVFEVLGMYRSLWKYASIEELLRGIVANIVAISVSYIIIMIFNLNHYNFSLYISDL